MKRLRPINGCDAPLKSSRTRCNRHHTQREPHAGAWCLCPLNAICTGSCSHGSDLGNVLRLLLTPCYVTCGLVRQQETPLFKSNVILYDIYGRSTSFVVMLHSDPLRKSKSSVLTCCHFLTPVWQKTHLFPVSSRFAFTCWWATWPGSRDMQRLTLSL